MDQWSGNGLMAQGLWKRALFALIMLTPWWMFVENATLLRMTQLTTGVQRSNDTEEGHTQKPDYYNEDRYYDVDNAEVSCAQNNGGCDGMCIAVPGGRNCTCGQGYLTIGERCIDTMGQQMTIYIILFLFPLVGIVIILFLYSKRKKHNDDIDESDLMELETEVEAEMNAEIEAETEVGGGGEGDGERDAEGEGEEDDSEENSTSESDSVCLRV